MKRIPTWLAIFEITIASFILLTLVSILVYAPFWILKSLSKKHHRPVESRILLWPLIAVLSLLCMVVICMFSKDVFISRLGNLTLWSFSLFLATIFFSAASVVSFIVTWRAPRDEVRSIIRIYSTITSIALTISTAYLAYWDYRRANLGLELSM